jgi:hypothetical protein
MPVHGRKYAYDLQVRPARELPVGPFAFDVCLTPTTQAGQELPTIPIHCKGTINNEVRAFPMVVNFGAKSCGDNPSETIVLQSFSGMPFQIESFHVTHPDLRVEQRPSPADGGKRFQVSQRIAVTGQQRAEISFKVRDASGSYLVCVPVTYLGTSPEGR